MNERATVLKSVKNWFQVLVLAVMALEAVIVFALTKTPSSDPRFMLYVILMIVFLLVVVVGLFLNQRQANQELKLPGPVINGKVESLSVQNLNSLEKQKTETSNLFIDSRIGISVQKPSMAGWHEPVYLSFKEHLTSIGVKDTATLENAERGLQLIPFGKAMASSTIVLFQYDKPLEISFTEESTTDIAEEYLKRLKEFAKQEGKNLDDKWIQNVRYEMFRQGLTENQLNFLNCFTLTILERKKVLEDPVFDSLGNLFRFIVSINKEEIDRIAAGEEAIMWSTNNNLSNVSVNGQVKEFKIHRYYRLHKDANSYFLVTIQWSPQTKGSIEVWNELKWMFESFRTLSNGLNDNKNIPAKNAMPLSS